MRMVRRGAGMAMRRGIVKSCCCSRSISAAGSWRNTVISSARRSCSAMGVSANALARGLPASGSLPSQCVLVPDASLGLAGGGWIISSDGVGDGALCSSSVGGESAGGCGEAERSAAEGDEAPDVRSGVEAMMRATRMRLSKEKG